MNHSSKLVIDQVEVTAVDLHRAGGQVTVDGYLGIVSVTDGEQRDPRGPDHPRCVHLLFTIM